MNQPTCKHTDEYFRSREPLKDHGRAKFLAEKARTLAEMELQESSITAEADWMARLWNFDWYSEIDAIPTTEDNCAQQS